MIKNAFNERKSARKSRDQAVDFLSCLVEELEKKETPLTEAIALDFVFILLFAAYETTSSAIALALKFLNHHPEALKELKVCSITQYIFIFDRFFFYFVLDFLDNNFICNRTSTKEFLKIEKMRR